nr:iron ABC transporter permease [Murinocardiopsis flavida]
MLAAVCVVSTAAGAASLTPVEIVRDLLAGIGIGESPLDERQHAVLVELRLPRVVMGAVVGGLLAVAGAGYQGVFRNPLADPYLLGAAGGAGLGATLVIVYGQALEAAAGSLIPVAAFAGALSGVMLAYALGSLAGGGGTATLLLAGVAVSSFLSAVQTLIQQFRIEDLRRIYSWVLGGLGRGGWDDLASIAPYALVSAAVLIASGYFLDMLALGDEKAASLGLNPTAVRLVVITAASLATACAVSVSGLVGFVGIVVPHIVRRLVGSDYRRVVPMSLLLGGVFLVLIDIVARTVISPGELPLGAVTAFLGAPFFLVILRATRNQRI